MRRSRPISSRGLILLGFAAALACISTCCLAWFIAVVLGWIEEDYPETILETEVPLRPDQLSSDSTLDELYDLGAGLLEDNGWELEPNLLRVWLNLHCTQESKIPEPESVVMSFADAYFDGVVPSIRFGYVSVDRSEGTASVSIEYEPLRWRHESIELARIEVDWREAWEISQESGGRALLEETGGRCLTVMSLHDGRWRVGYVAGGNTSTRESSLVIWVDAETGDVEVTRRPSEPSR